MRSLADFERRARELDQADPLARFRPRFHVRPGTIYMDGNSLGLLSIDAELAALTLALQACAPAQLPQYLGAMSWELLRREVGDWRRFRNRRQVASYTGLCPSEHSSGQSRLQGSITRHGNPRIRHLLVEAAWRLLRYQPAYRPVAKWREAFLATPSSPARRKKMIVAIARQLAIDLWRMATGRVTAAQLGLATT